MYIRYKPSLFCTISSISTCLLTGPNPNPSGMVLRVVKKKVEVVFRLVPHNYMYFVVVVSVLPLGRFLASMFLSSHGLGKNREVVFRCLPPRVFIGTPSPASMSFTARPSSSLVVYVFSITKYVQWPRPMWQKETSQA